MLSSWYASPGEWLVIPGAAAESPDLRSLDLWRRDTKTRTLYITHRSHDKRPLTRKSQWGALAQSFQYSYTPCSMPLNSVISVQTTSVIFNLNSVQCSFSLHCFSVYKYIKIIVLCSVEIQFQFQLNFNSYFYFNTVTHSLKVVLWVNAYIIQLTLCSTWEMRNALIYSVLQVRFRLLAVVIHVRKTLCQGMLDKQAPSWGLLPVMQEICLSCCPELQWVFNERSF